MGEKRYAGLDEWFRAVVLKAWELRGVRTPTARADAIFLELEAINYGGNQAKNAEQWIFTAQFSEAKKQSGLELSDFFPIAANFAKQLPADAVLTTERDQERIRQEAYRRGRDDERIEQEHKRLRALHGGEETKESASLTATIAELSRQRADDEKLFERLRAELKLTKRKLKDAEYELRRLQKLTTTTTKAA